MKLYFLSRFSDVLWFKYLNMILYKYSMIAFHSTVAPEDLRVYKLMHCMPTLEATLHLHNNLSELMSSRQTNAESLAWVFFSVFKGNRVKHIFMDILIRRVCLCCVK